MDTRLALTLLVLAAALAGLGDRVGVLDSFGKDVEPAAGTARVERVVDGDTIKVRLGGRRETIRYIGVDTPETKKPGTPVQCFGKAASAENERLVEGEAVRLVVGEEERDRYGRLLAYVYRARDGLFVNERLVEGGFARTLTIRPNDRYERTFTAAQARASAARAGLWGRC